MVLHRMDLAPEDVKALTGWEIKPEGACKGEICVPLTDPAASPDGTVDMRRFAQQMDMPVVSDEKHALFALGPRAGGRVLDDVVLPPIALPDFDSNPFDVASLKGRKVLLLAWSSW
jgi:hypothetical protein